MKDVVDSSKSLPVAAAGEVQAVGSLPYPFLDSKRPYEPVLQFPGSLQSQVLSTQKYLVTNYVFDITPTLVCMSLLGSLRAL